MSNSCQKLYEKGWKEGLLRQLVTDPVYGISEKEEEIKERWEYFGTNEKAKVEVKTLFSMVVECFEENMLWILLLAALVSFLVGIWKDGIAHGWLEGVTIIAAVVIIVCVTAGNNYVKEM